MATGQECGSDLQATRLLSEQTLFISEAGKLAIKIWIYNRRSCVVLEGAKLRFNEEAIASALQYSHTFKKKMITEEYDDKVSWLITSILTCLVCFTH